MKERARPGQYPLVTRDRLLALLVLVAPPACGSTPQPADAATQPPTDRPDATSDSDAPLDDGAARTDVASESADARPPGAFTGTLTTGVGTRSATCPASVVCTPPAPADRETTCGTVTSAAGTTFAVPAPVANGDVAVDLYDTCRGTGLASDVAARLVTRVVDADGAVVTGYLFADNYFELYVNGRYVARDSVGFTPFNAAAVRFQARYPMTIAVRLVDWEGFLGVGLESRSGAFHIGDGGFIASFSNGIVTGATWRCRPAYIAPLDDGSCLTEDADGNVDSSRCPSTDATVRCVGAQPERTCMAAHAPLPPDWASPTFDASRWTAASLYDAARVTNDPAYTTFAGTFFASARFIWSRNLDLDNDVICRVNVASP